MSNTREPSTNYSIETVSSPLPKDIPHVDEIGATSAPLLSAAFFIGARCKPFNDDFMQCKSEKPGNGEIGCLKEGRRVTRCAASVLSDINKNCLDSFRLHWNCLEQNNHALKNCRKAEKLFNKCVFDKLNLTKTIPGVPEGETPIHLKEKPLYVPNVEDYDSKIAYKKAQAEGKI
ncbi:hypothetical protein DASC09_061540 [Saccharomycopsis crataegensis]|uniref:NADH-ubiquinone oxidoreductase n=1 Tax=Saccharomycopsis crataegensis TaxID=43959 RepID=A0AAV5QV29_9ASCO|nr:hypothetical protein DASC09_061540 [Saccharomycopsis crataegensis]